MTCLAFPKIKMNSKKITWGKQSIPRWSHRAKVSESKKARVPRRIKQSNSKKIGADTKTPSVWGEFALSQPSFSFIPMHQSSFRIRPVQRFFSAVGTDNKRGVVGGFKKGVGGRVEGISRRDLQEIEWFRRPTYPRSCGFQLRDLYPRQFRPSSFELARSARSPPCGCSRSCQSSPCS